jgi:hypothetical protein
MAQSSYPAGGDGRADGEAVGCRKMVPHSETRPTVRAPRPAAFGARRRAYLSRAYHTIP